MVDVVPDVPYPFRPTEPASDPEMHWPKRSPKRCGGSIAASEPVIVAGVEIHRFGLQDDFVGAGRGLANPDRRHDAGQERHQRTASALRRLV